MYDLIHSKFSPKRVNSHDTAPVKITQPIFHLPREKQREGSGKKVGRGIPQEEWEHFSPQNLFCSFHRGCLVTVGSERSFCMVCGFSCLQTKRVLCYCGAKESYNKITEIRKGIAKHGCVHAPSAFTYPSSKRDRLTCCNSESLSPSTPAFFILSLPARSQLFERDRKSVV